MTKVAIVTGAGTGIGKATALRLAKDGYKLAVCFSKSKDGAENTVMEILKNNGTAKPYQVSIESEESVKALYSSVLNEFSRIDIVINNAGIGHYGKIRNISMDEYDHIFNINARGTFLMCREGAKNIHDDGRIINISTGATTSNMEGQSLYTASKLAIEGFTKVLAKELGKRRISVNIVSPGMTDTPILEGGGDAEGLRQQGAKIAAMNRCGEPDDIANAIAAFVSSDCSWITGQNLHVDGGSVII